MGYYYSGLRRLRAVWKHTTIEPGRHGVETMHVLAIIPARGGSKAIPRKNLRLLGGIPLIGHAIRACLASKLISETIVSTEDEEVAVVARRFGAEVIKRPDGLAGDAVPLAPVVHHVVCELERRGRTVDIVATIQPTSPLIKPETLDRGLALFDAQGVDTVVSVYDNTHLNWTIDDETGQPRPMYASRVNRQLLPTILTESGGLIASRRSVITETERVGKHVEVVILDREEAVDIDTYHDWWLAEKIVNRKRIVFHVVGSRLTGLGHVHRALTLARRLTDHEILFVAASSETLAATIIEEGHYSVHSYKDSPIPALERLNPDIVVNDVLDTEATLVREMKRRGWRVVNFEDHGEGADHADVVINALYEDRREHDNAYAGADYYCLREEFFTAGRTDARPRVESVLICFGGTDPSGLTVKTVRAIRRLSAGFRLIVVVGPGFDDDDELSAALDALSQPWEIVRNTKVISHYMENADLMITSAGRTIYEAATIGVPALVLYQNQRERKHVFASKEHGFINLGLGSDISEERLATEIRSLGEDHELRRELQRRMWQWDGRAGIERVIRLIVGRKTN